MGGSNVDVESVLIWLKMSNSPVSIGQISGACVNREPRERLLTNTKASNRYGSTTRGFHAKETENKPVLPVIRGALPNRFELRHRQSRRLEIVRRKESSRNLRGRPCEGYGPWLSSCLSCGRPVSEVTKVANEVGLQERKKSNVS